MKQVACALLVIAGSLQAQNNPAIISEIPLRLERQQGTEAEATSRQKASEAGTFTRKLADPAVIELLESGPAVAKSCAIPLLEVPVQDKERFAIKTVPAVPEVDPRILVNPPLPACAPAVTEKAVTVPAPAKPVK